MTVSYLGPKGTFTGDALDQCKLVAGAERTSLDTIADCHAAALAGATEFAFVPFENSREGAVSTTLDCLFHRPGLVIRREVFLPITQHLLCAHGSEDVRITRVLSHPQALAQCAVFLRTHMPNAELLPTPSTAAAAQEVASHPQWAAIGSRTAAAAYDLSILVEDINDEPDNVTRFVLLGRPDRAEKSTGRDITTVAFTGKLKPVLDILPEIRTLHTRPRVYFVDLDGHAEEAPLVDALKAAEKRAERFLRLGSYPLAAARHLT